MKSVLLLLPFLIVASLVLGIGNAGGSPEFAIGCFVTSGVALVAELVCLFLYRMFQALEQVVHDAAALNQ